MRTWESVKKELADLSIRANKQIELSQKDIARYPHDNNNGEFLSQLLANLNHYVQVLGEIHAQTEQLKIWTDKRYDIEKGLEKYRLVKEEKMAIGTAEAAKYDKVQEYLDVMVDCAGLDKRVQNARSSARDTTEAIRSRIGQLRGQLRGA